ncbi:hypothetical protein SFRURICE_008394 [Spodoptera frugiperda]|nr:hypothetical protein SFRURICE_008394 [Spodoptera frugiperda]
MFIASRHVTPSIPEGVGRGAHYGTVQCTPTFPNFCCKCHEIGCEPIAIPGTLPNSSRNNNLWITQRVAPCMYQTRYTLRGSRLPSHCSNRAVLHVLQNQMRITHTHVFSRMSNRLEHTRRPNNDSVKISFNIKVPKNTLSVVVVFLVLGRAENIRLESLEWKWGDVCSFVGLGNVTDEEYIT